MSVVLLEVRSQYYNFSKSQKKIADYLIANPDEFVKQTAHQIGEYSHTSSASVIRFAKLLKFEGLEELKRQLVVDSYASKVEIDPIISQNDNTKEIVQKLKVLIDNSINDLFFQLDHQKLEQAIELIRNAKKTYIFGIGASALPAYDMFHKFMRLNKPMFYNFDSHMTLEFLHYATKDDLVVLFSYSGDSVEISYPGTVAKERGIPVIGITSKEKSPVAMSSDIVLTVPQSEDGVRVGAMTSKMNSLIIADLLYLGAISPNLEAIKEGLLGTSQITREFKVK